MSSTLPNQLASQGSGAAGDVAPPIVIRLYVAGETPNSVRAQANFAAALARSNISQDRVRPEIIDVFSEPKRARNDGIIITPTLLIFSGGSCITIIGDLSESISLDAHLGRARARD